jgi:hypothetical protein
MYELYIYVVIIYCYYYLTFEIVSANNETLYINK